MSDTETNARLLIARTQSRLDAQSRENDALDVKALGVVATDAAVFALMAIVHHDALNSWWAVPATAIAIGGVLLLLSVFRQKVDTGPPWATFWAMYGGEPSENFSLQVLSDLLAAIDWNDQHGKWKDVLFEVGFRISVLGLALSALTPFFR